MSACVSVCVCVCHTLQNWLLWGRRQGRAGGSLVQHRSEPLLCCAQVCLLRCTLLSSLLLLLICSIHETEQNSYCQQIITEKHLAELEELVSALLGPAAGQRLAWGRVGANQPPRALWQLHEQSDSTQEPSISGQPT